MNETKQKRINFYLLLELPYDPPVEDEHQIQEAITKKISEWRKQINNSKMQNIVREYLSLRPEIERIMLHDKVARKQEAKNAKKEKDEEASKVKKAREANLDAAIRIQISKGYITDEEIKVLANTFNFSISDVERKIPKGKRKNNAAKSTTEFQQAPSLDSSKINRINRILTNLAVVPQIGKIPTLYDFFGMPENIDDEKMVNLAQELNQKLSKMPPGKASVDDKKELCGTIISIFKNTEERKKYVETLNQQRFERLKIFIDLAAKNKGIITAPTYQQLISLAGEEGIFKDEAEKRFERYFIEKNIHLVNQEEHGKQVNEKIHQCINCGTVNSKGTKFCVTCGTELEQKCSFCQTISPVGSQHCQSCGASFKEIIRYKQFLQDGYAALNQKKISIAEDLFEKAKVLFNHDDVKKALNLVKQKKQQLDTQIQLVKDLIQQKKIYTAQIEYNKLINLGTSKEDAIVFHREIAQVINEIETIKKAILPQHEDHEKITAFAKILNLSTDCQWAINHLKQMTPIPPVNLQASTTNEGFRLSWTLNEPEGFVRYKIVRKENIAPKHINDGELLASTNKNTFIDSNSEFGKTYWYAIFSTRDQNLVSKPTIRGPHVRIAEVSDLVATSKNNGIQLTWKLAVPIDVEIWKKEGSAPKRYGDGELLKEKVHYSFLDVEVVLGKKYGYTLFTKIVDARGKTLYSKGVSVELFMINTIPISDLKCDVIGDVIQCTWTTKTKEPVKLYQTTTNNPFKFGEYLPINVISQKLSAVSYKKEVAGQATISKVPSNELYIVPITVSGNYGIVGKSCLVKVIPSIKNIKTSVSPNQCQIEWDWPKGIHSVSVVTSETEFPNSPNKSKQHYSKAQYNQVGGLVLPIEQEKEMYITIFAVEKHGDQLLFAKGVHAFVSTKKPPIMTYFIERKKIFSKKTELVICFENHQSLVPELVVIKKVGSQPLNISDGEEICTIHPILFKPSSTNEKEADHFDVKNATLLEGKMIIDLTKYREINSYIRIFFKDAQDAKRFILEPLGKMKLG